MRMKASSRVLMLIMAIMLVFIIISLQTAYFASKVLPLILGSAVFVLSAVALWKEQKIKGIDKETESTDQPCLEESKLPWQGYLRAGSWVVGYLLATYFLGIIVASALFIISYMRMHSTGWLTATIYTVLSSAVIYGLFEIALKVQLYRGLFFDLLGS